VTETLDLPIIESAPAVAPKVRTEVAVAAAAALDLSKIDLTDVALAQFGNWRQKVKETKADVSTMVLDLSNQSKINEAKSLRQRLFNQPRADARNVSKLLKSKLSSVSKEVGAEEAKVIEAYDEAEKPLTEQIDAAQAKLDAEKEAARRAEEERLAGLRATVDQVMAKWLDRAQADGMTAERIGAGLAALQALLMPDELGDVTAYWTATKAATVTAMERLQVEATRREEAARLEALRIENERIAAEQRAQAEALAEQQRKLEAQAAELERQRKEMEAAQARAAAPVAADTTADTPACVAGKAENPEAAQDSPAQAPQQVLKAEAETPDATDRGQPVIASPVGGPMGAGQPAAAGPTEGDLQDTHQEGANRDASTGQRHDAAGSESPAGRGTNGASALGAAPAFLPEERSIETSEDEAVPLSMEQVKAITAPRVIVAEQVYELDHADLLREALELTRYAAAAFDSKFPSQPKPGPDWWKGLRERVESLQPLLSQALQEG
jgi:septal ring factor EnvC (AmiA/AmiB activator)